MADRKWARGSRLFFGVSAGLPPTYQAMPGRAGHISTTTMGGPTPDSLALPLVEVVMKHPSLSRKRFEQLVDRALRSLPDEFRRHLQNVAILVEDEPPPGVGEDTLGLYEGVPLSERGVADTLVPDRITLFRKPIERACRTMEDVEREVRATVLHEVGHFFGLEEPELH